MARLDFEEIARLINHSRRTEIDLSPIKQKEGRWVVYGGVYRVHTLVHPFKVLYLHSAASQEDVRTAARELREHEEIHVVYPPSLSRLIQDRPEIRALFKHARGVWSTKKYLWSFIEDELKTYLTKLAGEAPQFYVDPKVETPSSLNRTTPNPLLSFLLDPPKVEAPAESLAILLAEPGQGKTYMSKHLVSQIARGKRELVPLMVDSSQWPTMSIADQSSLSKTIAHSFRHFGAPIAWVEGYEEEFLRTALKADIFRVVFDGFDEYILRNRGTVQPLEVLEALAELAGTTGTRIIITSRTSFWHTNLPDSEIDRFVERTGSFVYTIQPFDTEQAREYFRKRLDDERKRDQAVQVYTALWKQNKRLVGRGFVLSLVADLADRGDGHKFSEMQGGNALLWLVDLLCERETERQALPYTSAEQIAVMQTFATEIAIGETPNTELLSLVISLVRPSLDSDSIQATVEKLKSHPLLEKDTQEDIWRFKQEQVAVALIADQITQWDSDKIAWFVSRAKLDAATVQDIGTLIVDLVRQQSKEEAVLAQLEQIIGALSSVERQGSSSNDDGRKLAGLLCLIAVDRFSQKGSARERTDLLLRICGQSSVKNLSFTGTIARHDFGGVVFDHCRFERVAWANCKFDEDTVFRTCEILGGIPPAHCDGFGKVQVFEDCRLDPEAEANLNSARVNADRKKYSFDDLKNEIRCVINKFVIKGGVGLKTVEAASLGKGPISVSRHKDEIIDTLRSTVLKEHHISGTPGGYNIRKEAVESVKFYAANNVFTGPLMQACEKLKKKLALE